MADLVEIFRDRLKKAFAAKEISKSELHRRTGLSRPMIDGYLTGAEPGLRAVEKVAEALGYDTPADLLGGVSDPPDVAALKDMLRARDEEILRLKVELAEARAKPRPASDPLEALLDHYRPTDPDTAERFEEALRALVARFAPTSKSSQPADTSPARASRRRQ